MIPELHPATVCAETRSQTLHRHVATMLRETPTSREAYAMAVVEHYHAHTPEHLREIVFRVSGDVFAQARANAQHIFRFFDDVSTTRLPADIEESLIAALPEPYCTRAKVDLCRRIGALYVRLPEALDTQIETVAGVTREFAALLERLAPILGDGRIDEADAPFFGAATEQTDRLIATVTELRGQMARVQRLVDASASLQAAISDHPAPRARAVRGVARRGR